MRRRLIEAIVVFGLVASALGWEFMLTIAPVPVTGGTGFPLNALATF